jgi:hypothetical protein
MLQLCCLSPLLLAKSELSERARLAAAGVSKCGVAFPAANGLMCAAAAAEALSGDRHAEKPCTTARGLKSTLSNSLPRGRRTKLLRCLGLDCTVLVTIPGKLARRAPPKKLSSLYASGCHLDSSESDMRQGGLKAAT